MKVKVLNRSKSTVIYSIPEDNITRIFANGESKMIDSAEIEKLTFQPGGTRLLKNFLLVEDNQVVADNIGKQEIEYWMTEEEVKNMMLNESYHRFIDDLDFAPEGVIDIIKTLAVQQPLTDNAKLSALQSKTGFNAFKAIENNKAAMEDEEPQETNVKQRRVAVDDQPVRRVKTYNVVNRQTQE